MATDDFDHLIKSRPDLLKELMLFKLAASLYGLPRIRQLEEDKNHNLVLRTTEGDQLPYPTHYV
jgi:hypothetical protein